MFMCDNCGKVWLENQLQRVFPDIPDLLVRIEPGGTVPAGECPGCGALVYPIPEPTRILAVLEGGLVQDVLSDRPDVEVAVLNRDLDGADEEEIVEITGDGYEMSCTLKAHDVTVAPELIDSAWRPVE